MLAMLLIHCPRVPKKQATDSETKGTERDFDVIKMGAQVPAWLPVVAWGEQLHPLHLSSHL